MANRKGRVTIPTDLDVVPQTKEIMERWGADALRDCDGTEFPQELKDTGAKIYATYCTTRKDNAWAKANPDEVQQCYISTGFKTSSGGELRIELMQGISRELMQVNTRDDIKRWWEVMDRTLGQPISPDEWSYDEESGCVVIPAPAAFHDYSVSFLAYLIWDPVHMYNAVTNGWTNFEHQITFDVRQPKTHKFTMERLRKFIAEHPYVNVIRYTTFFHQFTLVFDELKREKYVDWYGYSASVSPYILEQFEREVGYKFRPEFIIDQGYYNNQYRVPSKEFKDFMAFQRREVAKLAKEMVDITHELGKEAMMFLGDHWIGTEPYMDEFKSIGLDAVVGSVALNLFRDGILGKLSYDPVYSIKIPKVIGEYMGTGSSANNGLVGDMYANLPVVLGVFLMPLILVILFRLLDAAARDIPQKIYIGLCVFFAMSFCNGSWSTVLLSGGFLMACIFLYLFPVQKEEHVKNEQS